MGRPQVALRRDHSDHVLAVGRHETTSVASRRHGWLLARPPRHGFVAPFSALPERQCTKRSHKVVDEVSLALKRLRKGTAAPSSSVSPTTTVGRMP